MQAAGFIEQVRGVRPVGGQRLNNVAPPVGLPDFGEYVNGEGAHCLGGADMLVIAECYDGYPGTLSGDSRLEIAVFAHLCGLV